MTEEEKIELANSEWARSQATPHSVGPAEAAAGLLIAPKAAATWGTGKVLEAGLNLIAPDAEDTLLEQAISVKSPLLKTGVKAGRLLYENTLHDIIDKRMNTRNVYADSFKRFNWKDLNSKVLWNAANIDQRVVNKAQSLINEMDDWRYDHLDAERPMTGFVKHHGKKPTFWFKDREYGVGWSRKKGNYEIFDVQSRIDRRAARLAGDKTSNPQSASLREIKIAISRDLNKQAKNLPVEEWDIIIQNPGDAYIEHLISVKSPYWKTKRGKNAGYLAGDSQNLKVLTDQNFKKLKDNIEKHVHAKYKNYYVDYDGVSQNLIIRNLETGEALPTQIPGYGKAGKWKQYIDDTLADRDMQSLVDVDPNVPPNVARQMENYEKARLTLDKLTDVEQNAILDYANGMSWKQIRAKYGKSINQSNLQLFKKKEYTKSEVLRILKEYKMDGKGSVKLDWINDPEYFPDE